MKRSFYQMLDVPPDAHPTQIDNAFARATGKLEANKRLCGTPQAVTHRNLMRDGYHILADPERRARYDAKLAEAAKGIDPMLYREGATARWRLRAEALIFVALATTLGSVVYAKMEHKMNAVRIEHEHAVERMKEEQFRPIVVDATQDTPRVH